MSSTPPARGTRAERDGTPADPVARRAIPEPSDADRSTGIAAGRRRTGADGERRRRLLGDSECQLLVGLAIAVGVIFVLTVVMPLLISLVRNF